MAAHPLPAVLGFARVAHFGSFTRAAAELEVSPSALSQSVRALEAQLGVRLLNRTTRQVALTEHGARFLERIQPGLAQIQAAFDDLDDVRHRPTGRLRINVGRTALRIMIEPHLPAFMARYPELEVELFADDTLADLVGEGFDAGIRLGESLARDMVAVPIGGPQRQVIVGAPAYFERHPPPRTPRDLAEHDCIRLRLPGARRLYPFEFSRDGRDFDVEVSGRLILNDSAPILSAARAGLGLAQVFEPLARADLREGRLVAVLSDWLAPFPGFYVYYPARKQLPMKLRVFVDFLREQAWE
ncbi:LysR family transcriptional regulator [Lysobacter sp. K5869]|uniref:LysR family transcriptional regulator n=1 Tax=Lysobacter sp. K5869 TaxID=2820808 RepID=UPI001C061E33|nr:LysR family transcriptional regulator [Lysobacter sp. K5869]QWP77630.1 LysR family transcriptional regulator [Lysobacter sp. K5869]